MFDRATLRRMLEADEEECFEWERASELERRQRRLAPPATNFGAGRGRFVRILERLALPVAEGASVCDAGAFPGTTLRLTRQLPGGADVRLGAAGLEVAGGFREAMAGIGARFMEMEFDARLPPSGPQSHILGYPIADEERFDVVVCTEVIEHTHFPLLLLTGLHRLVRPGGIVLLTTNSAGFVGDLARLVAGRHNVEPVERSHVLTDNEWRPHIRFYTVREISKLFELCGFAIEECFYFDNGNVYAGSKGAVVAGVRAAAGLVPHLRSHVFATARRTGVPSPEALQRVADTLRQFGLEEHIRMA